MFKTNLPEYKSHKIVRAAKISRIIGPAGDSCIELHFEDKKLQPIKMPIDDYYTKHKPQVGGYFVEYKNGYCSWSPAKDFEEGYNNKGNLRITPLTTPLNYSLPSILKELKYGRTKLEQQYLQKCIDELNCRNTLTNSIKEVLEEGCESSDSCEKQNTI